MFSADSKRPFSYLQSRQLDVPALPVYAGPQWSSVRGHASTVAARDPSHTHVGGCGAPASAVSLDGFRAVGACTSASFGRLAEVRAEALSRAAPDRLAHGYIEDEVSSATRIRSCTGLPIPKTHGAFSVQLHLSSSHRQKSGNSRTRFQYPFVLYRYPVP
jgi:hypothetical protein